ncbi:MAG TPA: cytochrome ubiquinol oxidase subunit I [Steroidobacteraceae bacterium]|nr:cytochrome ubiquinol oxidase subunit I [Steroidobacteraceae bacterium]
MDPVTLARVQFGANISFHILFPSISIALAWLLLYFKWRYGRSREQYWMDAYRLWVKVFALTFALGVVSGVTMSFQFGTNWPGFMETAGNVAGPLLAYEVLTAFFLEATFLAVMLFGIGRVSNRMHTLATVLVAFGTSLSAFWILVLNSWMQTPAGFNLVDGHVHATDWLAILFNPSMPWRVLHMLLASGLTVAFLTGGLSAWRLLRGEAHPDAAATLRTAVRLAAVLIPLQILAGDQHGLNTLQYQPAKIAAMEGVWHTEKGAPLLLFAWPDEAAGRNEYAIGVPRGASLILRHAAQGEVQGLDRFPDAHPPVKPVFFGFRVMVGMALLMLAVAWTGAWLLRGGRAPPRPWLRIMAAMTFSGWVAVLAGWYVTEIGRQPWLVYGVLRTADAATTKAIPLVASLTLYLALYAGLICAYIGVLFYLARKAGQSGPGEVHNA